MGKPMNDTDINDWFTDNGLSSEVQSELFPPSVSSEEEVSLFYQGSFGLNGLLPSFVTG